MRRFRSFAVVAALMVGGAGAAQATPVTYDFNGFATGTLAGSAFATNFDIFVTGDTSGVEQLPVPPYSPGTYVNGDVGFGNPTLGPITFSITLDGLGVFTLSNPGYIFNVAPSGIGGFGSSTGGDFAYMSNPGLTGYQLTGAFGPLAVTGSGTQSVDTSGGNLAFNAFRDTTFTANGGAVPEPATWAMMLLGFGGLGAALRHRQTYRLLEIAPDGATSSETFRADDDQSALAQALEVAQGVAIEVWRDDALVTRCDLAALAAA